MTQENKFDVNYPQSSGSAQSPATGVQLRDDIARTRAALNDDVKSPGEKVEPVRPKQDTPELTHPARETAWEGAKDMVHDAKTSAVDSLRGARDHALESISDGMANVGAQARAATQGASRFTATHAIPLALLGAGAGWLLLSLKNQRRQRRSYDPQSGTRPYDDNATGDAHERPGMASRAADMLGDARERVMDGAHAMESRIADGAGALRDKVTHGAANFGKETAALSRRAYSSMGRLGTRARALCEDNPLAIALVAIASGTAFGMLLPSTQRENALLGNTRDKLMERVQHTTSEFKDSMERHVGEVKDIIEEVRHPSSHA